MTRVAKKNKTGREKLSPDVTAALQPQRVNLGLTYHSYSHHMHTQSSELQQSSGDNWYLCKCSVRRHMHTNTHKTLHVTLLARLDVNKFKHTNAHTNVYTFPQAKNKDINMTKCLCGSTQRSIHTHTHSHTYTHTHSITQLRFSWVF